MERVRRSNIDRYIILLLLPNRIKIEITDNYLCYTRKIYIIIKIFLTKRPPDSRTKEPYNDLYAVYMAVWANLINWY